MPGLLLPLVAWGAPAAIHLAPWVSIGALTVTGGQADPFGGTGAVLLDDTSAAVFSGRSIDNYPLANGTNVVLVALKAGTSGISMFRFSDGTLGVQRIEISVNWGTLTPSFTNGTGPNGTFVGGLIPLGLGFYGVMVRFTGIIAGNNNQFQFYPAYNGAAATGSCTVYLRNMVLLDYPDEDKPFDSPPPGSARVRAPSGIVDRWIPGGRRDYRFKGTLRWIPSAPRSVPQIVSGWDGLNEAVGVNCGVRAMLEAGQEGNELLWVPDRSNCAVNIPSDLVEPFEKEPYDWENAPGDRKVPIELVNTTTVYPSVL